MPSTAAVKLNKQDNSLKSSWLDTPLGLMIAIADKQALYFLEFVERQRLEEKVEKFSIKANTTITQGNTTIIELVESELKAYFSGTLKNFQTPLHLTGSSFQKSVWNELLRTPYGETRSYSNQAIALEKPLAYRAVANANGANNIAIIIPCHRIIANNGGLGGYGGGTTRKQWLLDLEKRTL